MAKAVTQGSTYFITQKTSKMIIHSSFGGPVNENFQIHGALVAVSIWRCCLTSTGNTTVELRQSYDHLISISFTGKMTCLYWISALVLMKLDPVIKLVRLRCLRKLAMGSGTVVTFQELGVKSTSGSIVCVPTGTKPCGYFMALYVSMG